MRPWCLTAVLADEDLAREWLEARRPGGPVCPPCGVIDRAYCLQAKPGSKRPVRKGVWKCKDCRKQFTVTIGTVFAETRPWRCCERKASSMTALRSALSLSWLTAETASLILGTQRRGGRSTSTDG